MPRGGKGYFKLTSRVALLGPSDRSIRVNGSAAFDLVCQQLREVLPPDQIEVGIANDGFFNDEAMEAQPVSAEERRHHVSVESQVPGADLLPIEFVREAVARAQAVHESSERTAPLPRHTQRAVPVVSRSVNT